MDTTQYPLIHLRLVLWSLESIHIPSQTRAPKSILCTPPKKPPTNWPIYQILFYFGHGILLVSLIVRLVVEPPYYRIAGILFALGELIVMGATY